MSVLNVKHSVLEILEYGKGHYLSGEELAGQLSVSRSAVWKAVKSLQKDGYSISAVSNKGYCLTTDNDILSEQSISKYLSYTDSPFRIQVCKTVDSTNTALKKLGSQGEPEGTVLVAEEQTAGRGRMDRKFHSPSVSGVYFSLLLRPSLNASEAGNITTAAAVAAARAIESVSGANALIKWVNDIYCNEKKVCGILTEASLDMETHGLEYAVLGIGINVKPPEEGFPEEIKETAGAVFDTAFCPPDGRSRLIAETLKNFWAYYIALPDAVFLNEYRQRSFLTGREIMVVGGKQTRRALALEIDDLCRLIVQYEDGAIETLVSGEVSIIPAVKTAQGGL